MGDILIYLLIGGGGIGVGLFLGYLFLKHIGKGL